MNLICEYISTALELQNVDYADKKSIHRHNEMADRMRAIARQIEDEHPELKDVFCQLLFYENAAVRLWAAHHMLEVMRYTDKPRANALREISVTARDDSVDGLGNKMWLDKWLAEHPEDKCLV